MNLRSPAVFAQLAAIRQVEYPILGVTAARVNANLDDQDPEEEVEEEDEEHDDDQPETDGEDTFEGDDLAAVGG